MTRDPTPAFRKSSYSNSQAACVEVAGVPGGRLVRDSKDPEGPRLSFSAVQLSAFIAGVRTGQLG